MRIRIQRLSITLNLSNLRFDSYYRSRILSIKCRTLKKCRGKILFSLYISEEFVLYTLFYFFARTIFLLSKKVKNMIRRHKNGIGRSIKDRLSYFYESSATALVREHSFVAPMKNFCPSFTQKTTGK